MNYTTEEQKTIKNAAKEYAKSLLDDNFSAAFYSSAMQQIIESRIKQAKIELLEGLAEINTNFIKGVIEDKLTELKK